jgi:hypothetical protein
VKMSSITARFARNRTSEKIGRRALTVVEIIMATVLLSLVISALYRMLIGSVQHSTAGTKRLSELQDVSLLIQKISSEIKNSNEILSPGGDRSKKLEFTHSKLGDDGKITPETITYEFEESTEPGKGGAVVRKTTSGQIEKLGKGSFAPDGFEALPLVSPQGARGVLLRLKSAEEPGKQIIMEVALFPRELRIPGAVREKIWQDLPK